MSNDMFLVTEEGSAPNALFRLWGRASREATRLHRRPIVVVTGANDNGRLVVIHESDFQALTEARSA
jgi:hypothetical protein